MSRTATEPGTQVAPRERVWLVVAMVMSAACVAQAFGRFTWGVVLPDARDDLLGGSNTLAGLFGTLNVTAYLVGTFAVSWAASRVTLVGLVRIGVSISTGALAIASVAPNGPVLAVALIAMGIGGAVIWIPSPAIVARALPPHRAGMATGLIGSGIGLGIVFSGQMAAFLDRHSDTPDTWQTLYRIELAIAVAVVIGVFVFLRSHGDRPSVAGGFGGFGALRTVRSWVPATLAYLAFGFAYILVIGFLVARLEDDAGFSSDHAAAMFSVVGAFTIVGGLTLGPLSDRIGRRVTLVGAFTCFAASALLILTGNQPWVTIGVIGAGMMFSGMPAMIIAHIVDETTVDTYGPAFSAATLAFGVAQMVSPQIGGALADATGSFTAVFLLSAAVALGGAVAASRLPDAGARVTR
jgi:MFS family permease